MDRKWFYRLGILRTAVLLITMVSLAGCGTAATPTTVAPTPVLQHPTAPAAPVQEPTTAVVAPTLPPAPTAAPVQLVMWASTDENGNPECRYKVPVDAFNSKNSNIQIELVARDPGGEEMRTVLAGGAEVPDLAETTSPDSVTPWSAGGLLLPLDNYAKKYGWQDRFLPWAFELGKVKGTLYALPNEMETLVLFINNTVFDEHGWKAPTTFAEFEDLAKQIKAAGLIPIADGGDADDRFVNSWLTGEYINHIAGPDKVYQALKGEIPWTDPAFVESIQKLSDHMKAGWIQNGFNLYKTLSWDDFHQSFATGEAPMLVDGTWLLGDLTGTYFPDDPNQDKWEWVPFPSVTGDAIYDLGIGSTLSINTHSKHPDEAAQFLDFYYSPETVALLYKECSTAPAPIHIDASTFQSTSGVDKRTADLYEALGEQTAKGNYGYTCWAFMSKQMCDVTFIDDIDLVWTGKETPAQWTAKLEEDYQAAVKDNILPPIPTR
ncbi:MAG: extracellular solute-binding protein [Chloroflexi bacterium]|nr:extracellular solute-binding protein [Chloroflexota bacterium]